MNVNDLRLELVLSYAQACRNLYHHIESLREQGYDLIVVPSRGASPFLEAAVSYGHRRLQEQEENLNPSVKWVRPLEQLYLPFTADISDDFPINSLFIRNFWTRVLSAIINDQEADVALRFYRYLRSRAGSLATGQDHISGVRSGNFIFIDTVVSGRAICEIFQAFERYHLDKCHFLLLVDQAGKKLARQYSEKLRRMQHSGRATVINVEHIFTEDEGPALSGIWSVTFPEMMVSMQKLIPELAEDNCIGAGLYYHEIARRGDGSNESVTVSNAILSTALFASVGGGEILSPRDEASTDRFLEKLKCHVRKNNLQDQSETKRIADPLIFSNLPFIQSTNVSGSHVLRAQMEVNRAEAFIREFKKI